MENRNLLLGHSMFARLVNARDFIINSIRAVAYFLLLFFSSSTTGNAQTTALSFTQIPFSNPDLIAPGRGVEHWFSPNDWDNNTMVQVPAGNPRGLDYYIRLNWAQIENAGSGTTPASTRYNWSTFDTYINLAIDRGWSLHFGILTISEGYAPYGSPGGADLSYPTYLHNQMQAEAPSSQDWIENGTMWVPNWNSPNYLNALDSLNKAIADHIATGSYNGIFYRNVVSTIDIRGFGHFGEWHNAPYENQTPAGRRATSSTLKRIIDSHKGYFPNYPLQLIMNAFDDANSSNIPADVINYALTQKNNWGYYGWRRDNWGQSIFDDILAFNSTTYNGWRADTAIMNRWKVARVTGEPSTDPNAGAPHPVVYGDIVRQVKLYHATSFGNGNFGGGIGAQATKDSIILASKYCGYRLLPEGGNMSTSLTRGMPFSITLNWRNLGLTPTYDDWNVVFELRGAGNTVLWSGTSAFNPKLFLPSGTATPITDNFVLPLSVPAGTYNMVMIIRDPRGYRKPLPLAITGRATDGSYLLRSILVTAAVNMIPVTNAGYDTTIASSVTNLDGTGSYDPDGTITAYNWTKISGPAIYTLSSATVARPSLIGLILGDYYFQLETTDNLGAKSKDTVLVSSVATILPVKWLYFKATGSAGLSKLTWATSGEFLNDRFEVEKSNDRNNFHQIGIVQGVGTSEKEQVYQFVDNQAGPGQLFYRLRQVSKDGNSSYSNIVVVNTDAGGKSIRIFPNPAKDFATVTITNPEKGRVGIALYTLDGKLVKMQQMMKDDNSINVRVDMRAINQGVYMLKITLDDKFIETSKIIKN